MEKLRAKANFEIISEEYHKVFEEKLHKRLGELWDQGKQIEQVQTFANGEYLFASIIWT